MSINSITDGTGKNYGAKVDSENRLHTHAFTVTAVQSAALQGDAFNTSTGILTLTTANESAIFYIKNNTGDDILVFEQFLTFNTSTGGSGSPEIKYYTNADSTSTIITSANDITVENRRLADSTALVADVYKGAEGSTAVTGSGTVSSFLTNGFFNTSPFVIPTGVSMLVSIVPPTGNTSQDYTFGLNFIQNASKHGND